MFETLICIMPILKAIHCLPKIKFETLKIYLLLSEILILLGILYLPRQATPRDWTHL